MWLTLNCRLAEGENRAVVAAVLLSGGEIGASVYEALKAELLASK
jgi:NAD+--asparagine ADP-ribosyltransferase